MRNLIKILYSPEEIAGGAAPTLDSVIDKAAAPEEKVTDQKPPEATPWKSGDTDRRKSYTGEKRRSDEKDPEFDMGYEDEREKDGQKEKYQVKAKLSEIKEAAKWLKDNRSVIQLGQGLSKQFKQSPEWAKAFDLIQGSMYKDGKYNAEYATKTLSMLEGKEQAITTKIDDQTDDIKEMEKDLEDLDPESPQAKILKRNIGALKITRAQMAEALKANKALQDKIEGITKFQSDQTTQQKQEAKTKEDQAAIALFDKTYGDLTNKETKDGYHIEDPDDRGDFEENVRRQVGKLALEGKITNDEQFTSAIRDAAKAAFAKIGQRNERIISGYLKTKQPAEKPPKSADAKPGDKSAVDAIDKIIDEASDSVFTRK